MVKGVGPLRIAVVGVTSDHEGVVEPVEAISDGGKREIQPEKRKRKTVKVILGQSSESDFGIRAWGDDARQELGLHKKSN